VSFFQQLLLVGRRYPVAVFSVLILVIFGVADYFLWQRRALLAAENERIRHEGETMFLSLSGHARIQAQSAETAEALAYIDRNLATESDLAGNLDYFYQIEKASLIRMGNLSQLSSQPPSDPEAYVAIPFSLRLSGSYPRILAYLHALETGPRLVRVKNYRFSQAGTLANELSLDLTVEMLGRP
jgi:Tfp pilus assembly protein PilO